MYMQLRYCTFYMPKLQLQAVVRYLRIKYFNFYIHFDIFKNTAVKT